MRFCWSKGKEGGEERATAPAIPRVHLSVRLCSCSERSMTNAHWSLHFLPYDTLSTECHPFTHSVVLEPCASPVSTLPPTGRNRGSQSLPIVSSANHGKTREELILNSQTRPACLTLCELISVVCYPDVDVCVVVPVNPPQISAKNPQTTLFLSKIQLILPFQRLSKFPPTILSFPLCWIPCKPSNRQARSGSFAQQNDTV